MLSAGQVRTEAAPPKQGEPDFTEIFLTRGDDGHLKCEISPESLEALRQRARYFLSQAIGYGYGNFPINGNKLLTSIVDDFFTERNICQTFKGDPGVTQSSHNDVRKKWKSTTLDPTEADKKGFVTKRLPLKTDCGKVADWEQSPNYIDVDECSDVTDEFDDGLPVSMYSVQIGADEAQSYLAQPSTDVIRTDFANKGPIRCRSDHAGSSDKVIYYLQKVLASKFGFILQSSDGQHWNAWKMLRSCSLDDGTVLDPKDLMFDNGFRVFMPVNMKFNGMDMTTTLVISSVAAAGTSWITAFISEKYAYERYVGSEFATKLLLMAKGLGWDIKK